MAYLPSDVAREALSAIASEVTIGNIEEGTREANICLLAYRSCLQQLLRAANWDCARRQAPMTLLADATGNTPYVGTLVPVPWVYEYAYPIDCMKARFVPWNWGNVAAQAPAGNVSLPSTPLTTGFTAQPLTGQQLRPARFLITQDYNNLPPQGTITWEVQGVSPTSRTVVLTNVQNAQLVYTALTLYPSVWDPQFRAAMVAFLASEIALPIWAKKDRNFALKIRAEQTQIARMKIEAARISDGNEGYFSSDISCSWMTARDTGGTWGMGWGSGPIQWGGDGPGVWGYGWDAIAIGGSAF